MNIWAQCIHLVAKLYMYTTYLVTSLSSVMSGNSANIVSLYFSAFTAEVVAAFGVGKIKDLIKIYVHMYMHVPGPVLLSLQKGLQSLPLLT